MLEIKNISKNLDGKMVVNDVSLYVKKGEIVGLFGPNGSGKSTTFYITLGFIKQDSGEIVLNGRNIAMLAPHERAKNGMIYLPQDSSIFQDLNVEDNIMIALEVVEQKKAARELILEQLISEFSLEKIRKSRGKVLSGGERRRVEIARCVASRPQYILLDEPFAGVDPIAISDIKKLIIQLRNKNIGILITDHNVKDTISITDHAYIIYDGRVLISGHPDAVINDAAAQNIYFGDTFK